MFAGRVIEKRKEKAQIMGEWNLGEATDEIKVKKEEGGVYLARLSKKTGAKSVRRHTERRDRIAGKARHR